MMRKVWWWQRDLDDNREHSYLILGQAELYSNMEPFGMGPSTVCTVHTMRPNSQVQIETCRAILFIIHVWPDNPGPLQCVVRSATHVSCLLTLMGWPFCRKSCLTMGRPQQIIYECTFVEYFTVWSIENPCLPGFTRFSWRHFLVRAPLDNLFTWSHEEGKRIESADYVALIFIDFSFFLSFHWEFLSL
jgi:hypothetical protein